MANCKQCRYFIPDAVGDGSGIGKCRVWEHYKDKLQDQSKKRLLTCLDQKMPIFWGCDQKHNCQKFEAK